MTSRLPARALAALGVGVLACALVPLSSAHAKPNPPGRTVVTASGLSLTVTPTKALNPASATVKVSGRGFNPLVGIYVAFCVTPPKGQLPTPCGGGMSATGSASSAWISSNPPPYGATLAKPYGKGGTFSVTLKISAMIGDVDCRKVSCSVVTRADHTRTAERAYDVLVPVTFR